MEWQPIETAPKYHVMRCDDHKYGPHILAWPGAGEQVVRCRWWWTCDASNFIDDCGRALRPTHWMPLPTAPAPRRT